MDNFVLKRVHTPGGSRVEESTDRSAPAELLSAARWVRLAFPTALSSVSRRSGLHKRGGNWYRVGYQFGGYALMSVALAQVTCFPLTSDRGNEQAAAAYRQVFHAFPSSRARIGISPAERPVDFVSPDTV